MHSSKIFRRNVSNADLYPIGIIDNGFEVGDMKFTILTVEDDIAIGETLTVLLEKYGFDSILAKDGSEGLSMIDAEKPDLVITDVMMGGMNGFELLAEIRRRPGTELLPVIMLTAKIDLRSRLHGLELGADDYLTKPFEFQELYLKISNLLNTRIKIQQSPEATRHKGFEKSEKEAFLNKLESIVDERMEAQDLKINVIADLLNMSLSTFQRKIKKFTGKSAVSWLNDYKLTRARKLIRLGYGTLSEIATKCGFKSLSYFSTSYKQFFGRNPSSDYP